jgi:hypothetical protein
MSYIIAIKQVIAPEQKNRAVKANFGETGISTAFSTDVENTPYGGTPSPVGKSVSLST